jgi:hypothetical protein
MKFLYSPSLDVMEIYGNAVFFVFVVGSDCLGGNEGSAGGSLSIQ